MSHLRVDPATLDDTRARLERLAYELTTLHIAIWQAWGTLGGRALEGELEHFCGTWHGATSRLSGQVAELGVELGRAAEAYRAIERRLHEQGRQHRVASGSGWTVIGSGATGGTTGGGSGGGSGSGTTVIG